MAALGIVGVQQKPRAKKPKATSVQTLASKGSRGGGLQPAFRAATSATTRSVGNTPQAYANTQRAVATSAQTGAMRSAPGEGGMVTPHPSAGWATPAPAPAPSAGWTSPVVVGGTPTAPGTPIGVLPTQPIPPGVAPGGYPAPVPGGVGGSWGKPAGPATPAPVVITPDGRVIPQPVAPPPAGGGTPTPTPVTPTPTPATPATPNADALFDADPRVIALNAWIASQQNNLMAQYGLAPVIGPDGKQVVRNGVPQWQQAGNAAPYSVTQTLRTQYGQQLQNVQNNANASGALFSGATAAGGQRAQSAYDRNMFDAINTFLGNYQGLDKQRIDLYAQLYPELAKKAADLADAAKPPKPPKPATPATPARPPQGRPASKPNKDGNQTKPVDKRPQKPALTPAKKKKKRGTSTMGDKSGPMRGQAPNLAGWR